jgi:hypothetical protein
MRSTPCELSAARSAYHGDTEIHGDAQRIMGRVEGSKVSAGWRLRSLDVRQDRIRLPVVAPVYFQDLAVGTD